MFSEQKRRDFLKTGSGTLLALLLQGCGSGGSEYSVFNGGAAGSNANGANLPSGGQLAGLSVAGRVLLSELGGTGLNVFSLHKNTTPVSAGGLFETTVGGQKAQALFITGSNQELRGLAIYLPGVTSLEVGLDSTALALLFLTLGITSVEPAEATERLQRLRSLSSFPAFRAYLAQRLASQGLAAIAGQPDFLTLREACVDEYFAAVQARTAGLEEAGFTAVAREAGDGYTLGNGAWRYVSVLREQLDANGQPVVATQVPDLTDVPRFTGQATNIFAGANAASFGTLFYGQVGSPTSAGDVFELDRAAHTLRYWIQGPGGATDPNAVLPDHIRSGDFGNAHYLATIFFYFFLPAIDIVSGGLAGYTIYKTVKELPDPESISILFDLLAGTSNELLAIDALKGNLASNDLGNIQTAIFDLLTSCANFSLTLLSVYSKLLPAGDLIVLVAPAVELLAAIFLAAGIGISAFNYYHAIKNWFQLPALTKLDIRVESSLYNLETVGTFYTANLENLEFSLNNNLIFGGNYSESADEPSFLLGTRYGSVADGMARVSADEIFITGSSDGSYLSYPTSDAYVLYYHQEASEAGALIPLPNRSIYTPSNQPMTTSVNNAGQAAFVLYSMTRPFPENYAILGVFNTETAFTEEIDIASLLDISGNFVSILSVDINDEGEVLGVLRNSVNPPYGDYQDTYVFRFKPRNPVTGQQARAEIVLQMRNNPYDPDPGILSARVNRRGDIVYQTSNDGNQLFPLYFRSTDGSTIRLQLPVEDTYFAEASGNWTYHLNDVGHVAARVIGSSNGGSDTALLFKGAAANPIALGRFRPSDLAQDDTVVGLQARLNPPYLDQIVVARPVPS